MSIFKSLNIVDFSGIARLDWSDMGQLNVITGANDTGKTHLLKIMYVFCRSYEEFFTRQNSGLPASPGESTNASQYFLSKLRSTFAPKLGNTQELISKNATTAQVEGNISGIGSTTFRLQGNSFAYHSDDDKHTRTELQATYVPPKEILSIFDAIVETREGSKRLDNFDDTYYDLVKDFRLPMAKSFDLTIDPTSYFSELTRNGQLEYTDGEFWFVRGNDRFGMHQVAEGIRKISIFGRLLKNQRIKLGNDSSIMFLDEPETNLHPEAIIRFAEFLHNLAQAGTQVFITTHSYHFLKRLEQLAKKGATDYTMIELRRDSESKEINSQHYFLKDGLPDNQIVDQSLWLYQEDVNQIMSRFSRD